MRLPIIVFENLDLSVFDSVAEAETSMEATDVENGEYRVFDALGTPLQLQVVQKKGRGAFGLLGGALKEVKINGTASIMKDTPTLRDLLIESLRASGGTPLRLESLALVDLLAAVSVQSNIIKGKGDKDDR